MSLQQDILLLLAHLSFEGLGLASVGLCDQRGGWEAVGVDGSDKKDALHSFRNGAVQSFPHQHRVELELVVRNTDQVDERVDISGCCTNGSRVVGLPGYDLRQRIRSEGLHELLAIA